MYLPDARTSYVLHNALYLQDYYINVYFCQFVLIESIIH